MTTIDLIPEARDDALEERVRELTEQLARERARNAGLERGLGALSDRVDALRAENLELRRRFDARG